MPITSVPVISTKYNEFQFLSQNNPASSVGEISSTCRYEGFFKEVTSVSNQPTFVLSINLYPDSVAIALSMQANITTKDNISRTYFLYSTTTTLGGVSTNNHIETIGMNGSIQFFYDYSDTFPWIEYISGNNTLLLFSLPIPAGGRIYTSGFYRLYQYV